MKSAIAIAGLAAIVAAAPTAESSSCPATTTSTYTYEGKAREYTTVTISADSSLPTEIVTRTSYITTASTTKTLYANPNVTVCPHTSTTTINVKHTPTSYTGDFTSSSLRPSTSCAPTRAGIDVYPEGTTTITQTTTLSAPQITSFVIVQTEETNYAYVSGTSTITYSEDNCVATTTSTTATASATSTYALKCAPTNMIGTDGIAGQRYKGAIEDGIASYGSGSSTPEGFEDRSGAHQDASACCQACQDDANCAASLFAGTSYTYPAPSLPWCQLWNKNADVYGSSCGLGFTIFPGDKQIASTGCGYIAENVWWEGECPEGLTPRECENAGYVNSLARS